MSDQSHVVSPDGSQALGDAAAHPSRIRVLSPELADQIAAGEVVERPASVVKELVENALDAGARRIEIDVEGGGRRLVRVVDDGGGMTPEEARLALRRHATSKLQRLEDLFGLTTMGFRGEALPSIAAVSRFVLTTRPVDRNEAFRLEVQGGVEQDARAAGAPVGTQVEARDLLWNVPARLKFLKAEGTEAGHITEAVNRLALAHPDVHFRLRQGGRVALDLPPHRSLLERVRAVLPKVAARLHPAEREEAGTRVTLFLAPPEEAVSTSRGLQLFVGKRFVRDRGLLHAVSMGYGELIPQGRYATAVVFVDPPAGSVDINVHPQKVEVRFARPQEIYAAVRHAVADAVARAPWLSERAEHGRTHVAMWTVAESAPPARVSELAASYAGHQESLLLGWSRPAASAGAAPRSSGGEARGEPPWKHDRTARPVTPSQARSPDDFFGSLSYLGQLDRTYLVCEAGGELVLIDQHAAHERIAFQRLRQAHAAHAPRTQRLLFPRTLDLDESRTAVAEAHQAELASLGFEVAPFGKGTLALTAAPAELRDEDVDATLTELLDDLVETSLSRAASDRIDAMLATIACHSVVRAGDELSRGEATALLESLDGVDFKAHCPHGRPVLLRISVAEIARRFGRT